MVPNPDAIVGLQIRRHPTLGTAWNPDAIVGLQIRCPSARKAHGDKEHVILVPNTDETTVGDAIKALRDELGGCLDGKDLALCSVKQGLIRREYQDDDPISEVAPENRRGGTARQRSSFMHLYALEKGAGGGGGRVFQGCRALEVPTEKAYNRGTDVRNPNSPTEELEPQAAAERSPATPTPPMSPEIKFHGDPFFVSVTEGETAGELR
jgi:hypothetical protein